MSNRSKAFFINGGAGRVLCSIPALEKYEKESGDKDFIIVCEGGMELYKGHPTLHKRAYDSWHKFEINFKKLKSQGFDDKFQKTSIYYKRKMLRMEYKSILNSLSVLLISIKNAT